MYIGICPLPDLHSVIVLLLPGLNNSAIEGKDCFFSLISLCFFVCALPHDIVCVCVRVCLCVVSLMGQEVTDVVLCL